VTHRYVALGSSMAAGPGISPTAPDAPFGSGRSAVNYPHLVAERLSYDLVDVTYSGVTTANVLTDRQHHARPQIEAIDGTEDLVTVTIGGNDAGYVPMLFVDYLTLLPPDGTPAPPLSAPDVAAARRVGDTLKRLTEDAAAATGCELVRAGDASVDHHPWSDDPWTTRFGLPVPGKAVPLHPNAAGMRAVADLVVATLS
jgi:lysophospholipase L1-like esterase